VDSVTVAHPHTNGQVEHTNGMILQGLKPRILTLECKDVHAWLNTQVGKWATEVPSILWSLRTTPNRLTSFALFFMVYGAEATLTTDLQYGSSRVRTYQPDAAEKAQKDTMDLLEESRDTTIIISAGYQQALQRYHSRKVHPRAFPVGDLVL
jgi:hypothetical protein